MCVTRIRVLFLLIFVKLSASSLIFQGLSEPSVGAGYCSVPLGISRDSINIQVGFTVNQPGFHHHHRQQQQEQQQQQNERDVVDGEEVDADYGSFISSTQNGSQELHDRTYIQVEFNTAKIITGIITQGSPTTSSRVTHFKITYSADCVTFHYIRSRSLQLTRDSEQQPAPQPVVYVANLDANTTTTTMFDHVISAKCVRVVPTRRIGNETAMSFELLGCGTHECQGHVEPETVSRGDNWQRFRFPVEKVLTGISVEFLVNSSQRPPGFVVAYSRTCNFDFGPRFLINDHGGKVFNPDEGSDRLAIDLSSAPIRAQCVAFNRIDPATILQPHVRPSVERRRAPIQHAEEFSVTFSGCDALAPHDALSGSCGKTRVQSDHSRKKRVVGGTPTAPGQWPWLVSLYFLKNHSFLENSGLKHLCGGSLIAPQWILSAAHCFHNASGAGLDDKANWLAVLGEHQQGQDDGTEQIIGIDKIILHPLYDLEMESAILHDIALLKMSEPAKMSDYVNTVCILPNHTFPDYTTCVTAGWGHMELNAAGGVELPNHASLHILPQSECEHRYHILPDDFEIKMYVSIVDSIICATEDGKDSCQGDSGGPLVCPHGDIWAQVGIVSIGFLCGDARFPGIYTRVSHFYDWIEEVMDEN